MTWHPDVPDLPIKKPKIVEDLECSSLSERESMRSLEIEETIEAVAHSVALAFKKQCQGGYNECEEVVSIALTLTGSALGGRLGTAMVAASEHVAKTTSRIVFPA
jgi:hypothetical protein